MDTMYEEIDEMVAAAADEDGMLDAASVGDLISTVFFIYGQDGLDYLGGAWSIY